MNNISKSASKIALLTVVFTLSSAVLYGVVFKTIDANDLLIPFISLTSAITGYYFANKGEADKPYLGK